MTKPNKFKGEIQAEAEGKTYTLRMDMGVLAAFETETGKNALAWSEDAEKGEVRIGELITMVHCAMERRHPEATREEAADLVSEDTGVLMRLMQAAAPERPAGNGRAPGTGGRGRKS